MSGKDYLIRGTIFSEKSLGPRSEKTERIYAEFVQGRQAAKDRLTKATDGMKEQSRLNKALKINRAPEIVAKLLRKLDERNVLSDFLVIGTHALFCYESLAGIQFLAELLASGDVDLLCDHRQSITVTSKKMDGNGLLGVLKQVDKSFEIMEGNKFRAVNADNFMVDLITPSLEMRFEGGVSFGSPDLVATEILGLQWLCNAPKVNSIAIDDQGFPFPIISPDPRYFALHKAWLSERHDRDPVKKPRDLDQARQVAEVVKKYLPNLYFSESMKSLHSDAAIMLDKLNLNDPPLLPEFKG